MNDFSRRRAGSVIRPAVFIFLLIFCLPASARASDPAEEKAVRASVEQFLRSYTEEAMLYVERDQRSGSVADPNVVLSAEAEAKTFQIGKREVTLPQMRDNIAFIEKKADYFAGMRQMQNIYREGLDLDYTFQEMTFTGDVCRVKVTEAAGFRYADSTQASVNEYIYWVDLVKLDGQWLVGASTDGSTFDSAYSKEGGSFDPNAALAQLQTDLQQADCSIRFPDTGGVWGSIPYNGANAAAYAYTYSRLTAEAQKPEYYNPKFVNYAGRGGDCMNFASQCMWAGFGGSETTAAISGCSLPMDTSGSSLWFGRAAEKNKINESWISCQAFRKYLTGKSDASGFDGTNGSSEPGMYATILDIGYGSPVTGVEAYELVGAAAQIEGGSGSYGHAIVITAADGLQRNQIYFCGHTKNVTHIKLGDCFLGEMKIYIPRYFRTGASLSDSVFPVRCQPVEAGQSGYVGAWTEGAQAQIWMNVTAPGGEEAVQVAGAEDSNFCGTEYLFPEAGLYRVDCYAKAAAGSAARKVTFYVRCFESVVIPPAAEPSVDVADEVPAGDTALVEDVPSADGESIGDILPEWLVPAV